MDAIDEIRLRMRISKIEAKLALAEIEVTGCSGEIRSPLTSVQRRDEATARRIHAIAQATALRAELDSLRNSPQVIC